MSKRMKEIGKVVGEKKVFSLDEAIEILKKCPEVKFNQSVEIALKLGIDPKKADQQVRGTVTLPNGIGNKATIVVIAKGEKLKEALAAGVDFAGSDDLINKIKEGWTDFTVLISTPDLMKEVGKLGKVLGPKGLMPTPKSGTVTNDISKAVEEIKKGKVEYKVDKSGVVNLIIGKLSFTKEKLKENAEVLLNAIQRAKPASSKGIFMQSLTISSTMGPGLKIDIQSYAVI